MRREVEDETGNCDPNLEANAEEAPGNDDGPQPQAEVEEQDHEGGEAAVFIQEEEGQLVRYFLDDTQRRGKVL